MTIVGEGKRPLHVEKDGRLAALNVVVFVRLTTDATAFGCLGCAFVVRESRPIIIGDSTTVQQQRGERVTVAFEIVMMSLTGQSKEGKTLSRIFPPFKIKISSPSCSLPSSLVPYYVAQDFRNDEG